MATIRRLWAPVVGTVAIIAGLLISASAPPASFGWFAYAPLSDTAFVSQFIAPQTVVGIGVAAAGLALLAGWVGYRLGTRRRGAPSARP